MTTTAEARPPAAALDPDRQGDEQYRAFLDNWERGFMDTEEDLVGYWMDCDWGRVPNELHGTLFR